MARYCRGDAREGGERAGVRKNKTVSGGGENIAEEKAKRKRKRER